MRSTCSVYVDAGYLLAAAATRTSGTSLRSSIHVDYRTLIESLILKAEECAELPVLRVHWYDSAQDAVPDAQQTRIGELRKVKLRLGRFGRQGEQKGVDLRIGLDLVTHARNNASDVFILVSGDDDLTEAVEEAQGHGVEVIVLAAPDRDDKPHGVSRHLLRAADGMEVLAGPLIDRAVTRIEVAPTPAAPEIRKHLPTVEVNRTEHPSPSDVAAVKRRTHVEPSVNLAYSSSSGAGSHVMPGYEDPADYDEKIDAVVTKVLTAFRQSASAEEIAALPASKPSVPRELDRAMLIDMADALDVYDLTDAIRHRLRERFWLQCE